LKKKLGHDNFPLIPIKFYPNVQENVLTVEKNVVAKVGTSHAGYGKMKFHENDDFKDFSTLLAMYNDYITVEPFVKNIGDIRVQKIGDHLRAFKRICKEGWKGNVSYSEVVDISVTDQYKIWMKEVSSSFGGLDICSLDAVIDEKGNHTILEVNDCCTGFLEKYENEDFDHVRELVMKKLASEDF